MRKLLAAVLLLAALLLPASAEAKWLRGESAHFVVYANTGESTLRDYVQRMEDYDRLLRRMHGLDPTQADAPKLDIYLVGGQWDVRKVDPQLGKDIAGFYIAQASGIVAVAAKPDDWLQDAVMRHEYYHHFMWQNFPGAYPAWMSEGMAEFFAQAQRQANTMLIGAPPPGRLASLAVMTWLPMEQLLTKSPFDFAKPEEKEVFYGEAWRLANYMMTDVDRRRRLVAYVDALRAGADPVKAWTDVIGETPAVTLAKLHDTPIKGMVLDKEPLQKPEVAISTMPPSADDLMLDGLHVQAGVAEGDKAALLAEIRTRAAASPPDRLSDLVLAEAEIRLGDPARAEPLLERRLKADPDDWHARFLQATSRLRAGEAAHDPDKMRALFREADAILIPAVKAHPHEYRLLYLYAISRRVEPGWPSENMVQVLENALSLAPQIVDFRLAAGDANEKRGHYDRAIGILSPLANDPHHPGAAKLARERLERLKAEAAKAKG